MCINIIVLWFKIHHILRDNLELQNFIIRMLKKNKPLKYHQSWTTPAVGRSAAVREKNLTIQPNSNDERFIYENEMTDWVNAEIRTKETVATGHRIMSFMTRALPRGICIPRPKRENTVLLYNQSYKAI